jgi:GcrA cell cycle regulator
VGKSQEAMAQWETMLPRLIELNAAGKSSSQIAMTLSAEFGFAVTRNAVIGKIHRHDLRPQHRPHTPQTRRPKDRAAKGALVNHGRYFKFAKGYKPPPEISEKARDPVFIVDLARHHCRWPIGEPADMRYCGADRCEPLPYCEDHARIAYNGTSSGGSRHFTRARRSRVIHGYT